MLPRILLILATSATLLRADALGDLKASLARCQGKDSLKAALDYRFWNQTGEDKKAKVTQGSATLRVEDDAQGLRLECSRAELDQLSQESKANTLDPERGTPIHDALHKLGPTEISAYLNAAEDMLNDLQDSTLVEVLAEPYQGVPARCLTVKVNPRIPTNQKKYIKELQATGRIWIGADGFPLGSTLDLNIKGRAFLVINFAHSEHQEHHYAHIGNRLVTTFSSVDATSSGGGESGKRRETLTVAYR